MLDPAYSQLLDTNQELRSELQDEIFTNKSNEKKVRSLVKELEQCYRTISLQDNTIIAHEKEIEELKSEISNLRKQLRVLQQDKKFKDEVGSIQDGRIIELENKVEHLKARIQILIDKKISINALDMATTNLIANINRGLERIENHIRGVGTPMQNPANVIDGIRGSLNTIRVTLQNITAERDQYQNLLNETNERERVLIQQLRDMRNGNLRSQHLLDESRAQVERTVRRRDVVMRERDTAQGERDMAILAYNNERKESRRWHFSYRDKDRRVQELLREKFAKQLLYQRNVIHLQQNTRQLQTNAQNQVNRMLVIITRKQTRIGELLREKFVFQLVIRQRDQNILNLRGQILALQNNPLGNMAAIEHAVQTVTTCLASIPDYDGQEPPDTYYIKLRNANEKARPLAVAGFNPLARTRLMISKMTGRFHPVPATNPYNAGNAINTEAEFLNWLQGKFRDVMIGNNRSALKYLMSESFLPADTPETYEKRIKPFVQGMVFADVLPYLYDHIPVNMQMRIRIANPANVGAFFTELRNIWLEAGGQVNIPMQPPYQASSQGIPSTDIVKLYSKIDSLETQLAQLLQALSQNNESLEDMHVLAGRLGMQNAPKNSSFLRKYVNDELEKRLGVVETNTTKLHKKISQMVNLVKKLSQHKCSNCGKAGHNSRKCTRKKKKGKSKKGKVNLATLDSGSGSDTNSDISSDDSSDSGSSSSFESESEADINVNITKTKKK